MSLLKRKARPSLLMLLLLCLVSSTVMYIPAPVHGAGASDPQIAADLSGHWAEGELAHWLEQGLLKGYADGTVQPDRLITRGEMMALINRAFGFTEEADISFADLPATSWVYSVVKKAVKAGYIQGGADGKVRSGNPVSRQEAAVMIAKIVNLAISTEEPPAGYKDAANFPGWSKAAIEAVTAHQVMKGLPDGTFNPEGFMSRAEAVVSLSRALRFNQEVRYDEAGEFGPQEGTSTIAGNVVVNAADVTLKNLVIKGNLLLAEGIGEGEIRLHNVIVEGTTTIMGGGSNRVPASTAKVTMSGDFAHVKVEASGIVLELVRGTIGKLIVTNRALENRLHTGEQARIVHALLQANIKVTGQGVIEYAFIEEGAAGTTFEKNPLKLEGPGAAKKQSAFFIPVNDQPSTGSGHVDIVNSNSARAVVMIRPNADQSLKDAAEELVHYIHQSAGVTLQVIEATEGQPEPAAPGGYNKIYIGFAGEESNAQLISTELAGMKADGFVISPYADSVTIIGPSAIGTKFGIYDFLERYVGVRWLMPGETGEDVPLQAAISVERQLVKEEPAFISRDVVGFMGYHMDSRNDEVKAVQMGWLGHNRNNPSINYHHNLQNLFPPSKYAESHPEFFPQLNGQPNIPASNVGWQPCFTAPGIVEEAVKNIKQYFHDHPNERSYSLGVIDGGPGGAGYCEAGDGLNSLGLANMSEVYYNWVNQVAAGVATEYPDKYFGLLAYANVYDPPSFPLHPNVIPILTDDRYTWEDPVMEQAGKQGMANWLQSAQHIAWYDYLYGSPYIVPRVFNERLAENLRYAAQQGVVGYFGEAYPNFAEGPKWWLLMKLLWNPELDEESLKQEWYMRAVGDAAAPDLASYYAFWEQFWLTHIFETEWYKGWYNSSPRNPYLPFYLSSYAQDITVEDLETSRALLEAVVQKAGTPQQKARAEKLLRGFELYEASVLSYPVSRHLEIPGDSQEAAALLDELLLREAKGPAAYAQKRMALIDEFESDPILIQVIRGPQDQGMRWSGEDNLAFLVRWISGEPANSPVRQHLQTVVDREGSSSKLGEIAQYLLSYEGVYKPLNTNVSFNQADASSPSTIKTMDWYYYYVNERRDETEVAYRTESFGRTDSASIAVTGITTGVLYTMIDVETPLDFVSASGYYYSDAASAQGGALILAMSLFDGNMNHLTSIDSDTKNISDTAGQWAKVSLIEAIPQEYRQRVKHIQFQVYHYGIPVGKVVYFDDVSAYGAETSDVALLQASAVNGSIKARLSGPSAMNPAAGDFTVMQKIDNGAAVPVNITNVSWDGASKTATLTVPPLPETPELQTVVYMVAYRDTGEVATPAFTVIQPPAEHENLVQNPSVEAGPAGDLNLQRPWYTITPDAAVQSIHRSTEYKFSTEGEYSIVTSGLDNYGAPAQNMAITPGRYLASVYYYVPVDSETDGKLLFYNAILDPSGNEWIGTAADAVGAGKLAKGTWTKYEYMFTVEDTYDGKSSGMLRYTLAHLGFKPGEKVYLDHFILRKIG